MGSILKRLMDALGVDDAFLLSREGLGKSEGEVLSLTETPEPFACFSAPSDFARAVGFLKQVVERRESVVVYGDYDVDGLTSTSILAMTLRLLDVPKIGFYIPSRYEDGYGLNLSVLKRMAERNYDAFVAVDNGITKKAEVEFLRGRGKRVLVLDHHEEQKHSLPPFEGEDCAMYHRNDVSAACLSLLACLALLDAEKPFWAKGEEEVASYRRYFFSLASLAVFSDCMPLSSPVNAALAKLGLAYFNRGRSDRDDACHGLYERIFSLAKRRGDPSELTFRDINFSVNAKLNALARMKGGTIPNLGAYFLQGMEKYRGNDILDIIEEVSSEKKALVASVVKAVEIEDLGGFFLVDLTGREDVPSGLTGLLANALLDRRKLARPILVLCRSSLEEGDVIGSFRSPKSFALDKAVDAPSLRSLLKEHGGHAQACGMTFRKADQAAVVKALNDFLSPLAPEAVEERSLKLDLSELGKACYEAYEKLEPFGQGFEKPPVEVRLKRSLLLSSLKGDHVLFDLPKGALGERRRIVWFRAKQALEARRGEEFALLGEMALDRFGGGEAYAFLAHGVKEEGEGGVGLR